MSNLFSGVDPHAVDTVAEFVTQLRLVRERSGLSYRQIARRAEQAGHVLPASTLATMLSRTTLPREDLVVALLTACGGEPEVVAQWLAVRRRLAWTEPPWTSPAPSPDGPAPAAPPSPPDGGSRPEPPGGSRPEALGDSRPEAPTRPDDPNGSRPETPVAGGDAPAGPVENGQVEPALVGTGHALITEPAEPTAPAGPPQTAGPAGPAPSAGSAPRRARPRRTTVALVAAGLVAVLAVAAAAVTWLGDDRSAEPGPGGATSTTGGAPPPGPYRIRLAHSGLCLSERIQDEDGRLYQASCGIAIPEMTLARLAGDIYQIHTFHPRYKDGCTGVPDAATEVNAPLADDWCTEPDAHDFRLEPVAEPAGGFRILAVHSGLCVGVPSAATAQWEPVSQFTCSPTNTGQVFLFEPRAEVSR